MLERIKGNSPHFFERIVVDIMVALGYGGSRSDAGKSIGQSGDEGVDGIIKEDRLGLDVIFLLAPTSGDDRIERVLRMGSGFLYYVSVTGVTGTRKEVSASLHEEVRKIRERSRMPVVVGFGISDPSQAGEVASFSDGVVVGSALVKFFENYRAAELREKVSCFVSSLKEGIRARRD
jgi:tryptophan synthase alpha chain